MNTEHKSFRAKRSFIEPEICIDNYILGAVGASLPKDVLVPNRDWKPFNTGFEDQKKGTETWGCAIFNTHDSIQRIGKRRYNINYNYSDRYGNIGCGTKCGSGNSPDRVAERIRTLIGCIPEEKLPFPDTITSCQEYLTPSPLPQELLNIGSKWRQDSDFGHEWVFLPNQSIKEKQDRIWEALQYSPVSVSVYAWRWNGQRYYKNPTDQDQHWTVIASGVYGQYWEVDDTYPPYIKKLDWNYNFSYGKRYHYKLIKEPVKEGDEPKKMITLKRAEGQKKVFVCYGSKKYWIVKWENLEDFIEPFGFKTLKEAQESVQQVGQNHLDKFIDAGVIGNPSIMDMLFGAGTTK